MSQLLFEQLELASGRLEKEALLATADETTKRMLVWALDPMITFGVTVDEKDMLSAWAKSASAGIITRDEFWDVKFEKLCENLSTRKITGNMALAELSDTLLLAPAAIDLKWAWRILNKNLRCGVQLSTVKKVFPGLIEPFACALAKPYEPEKHELEGAWCVEPKLDGLRMVVVGGVAYTRNGRVIESVGHVLAELSPWTGKLANYVFDGEIMGSTEFDEDSGKIRKKGEGPNFDLKYNIFDIIKGDEWAKKKTESTLDRKQRLSNLFNPEMIAEAASFKYVRKVPWKTLTNPTAEKLFEMRDKFIADGYEGVMLKDLSAPYVFKRSDSLLKLKDFVDADGEIVGSYEGKGRHAGRLGGLVVSFDGIETKVGSGFSDEQRTDLWNRRHDIIGSCVEVQYQNKTTEGSLRFPVFVKFRPDKDE